MLFGISATFFKEAHRGGFRSLRQAVVEPFTEFVGRNQWSGTASIILLMVLYKLETTWRLRCKLHSLLIWDTVSQR